MSHALHPRQFSRQNPVATGIGALFVFLAGVRLWSVVVATGYSLLSTTVPGWPESPMVLGAFVARILGFALPALAYVAVRNLDVELVGGHERAGRTLLAAVGLPALLAAGIAVVAHGIAGTTMAELAQHYYSPDIPVSLLLQTTVAPAVFEAVGVGLLLFAAVQTRLADLTTPEHGVVLTVVVAGVFYLLPTTALGVGRLDAGTVAVFGVGVLLSVVVGLGVGLMYRGVADGSFEDVARWAYAPILVLAWLGAVGGVHTLFENPGAAHDLGWLVTIAVASEAYRRADAVWAPMLALLSYRVAVEAVIYVEVLAGVAPMP